MKESAVQHGKWKMLKNQGLKAHKKRVDRNTRVKKINQNEKTNNVYRTNDI
jgi:hypothetical protein